ncbi:MAG: tyrosine--tRNA ligase [Nanoarchaeota archaeon]
MDINERIKLIKEVGEEIVTEDELTELLNSKKEIIAYDGFEPSGKIHIAQSVIRTININKLIKAGIKFKMFVADWHAWANNKMGGDLEKIQTVGKYFIEVWKACGMDLDNVEFVFASDLVKDENYWKIVMDVSRNSTLKRVLRCSQIMGRNESDSLSAAQILYPCMQTADIFYLKADICQLGLDQRKVNMLAREIGPKIGFYKPISISHRMLLGLIQQNSEAENAVDRAIELKMSKSKPDSAVFVTDTKDEIVKKINKAYCPEGIKEDNPILEYCKYIIFEKFDCFKINRPEKFGGDISFNSYNELENSFVKKELHPGDLKKSVGLYINEIIDPIRKHFENDSNARELLEKVKSYQVTR